MKKVVLLVSWASYLVLLMLSIMCLVITYDDYLGKSLSDVQIIAAMDLGIFFGVALIVPVVIRWKLKSATWGTFAVTSGVLAAGLHAKAQWYVYSEVEMLPGALSTTAAACLVFSVYFLYRHFTQVKSITQEIKATRTQHTKRDKGKGK